MDSTDNKYFSRKFVLTLMFALIMVGNYWVISKEPISWEALMALAVVFGIYSGSNAYESAKNSPNINEEIRKYITVTEEEGCVDTFEGTDI